jgi:hypothetical protein
MRREEGSNFLPDFRPYGIGEYAPIVAWPLYERTSQIQPSVSTAAAARYLSHFLARDNR